MCFNIAEAINRGWVTGNAEDWYKKGIKASLGFYGIPVDGAGIFNKVYPYGATNAVTYPIPFDFENVYYQQGAVKYSGNNATGLQQILLQNTWHSSRIQDGKLISIIVEQDSQLS
nr:hypothetical protein [Paraflavitalea speifideiaquila]